MPPQHGALAQALGARRQHILLADFLQKRVLGQHGDDGEAARRGRQHRQGDVPQVVGDLVPQTELRPAVGHQPAQRKPLQPGAARKQHQQQHAQHEAWNGVAHQHRNAGGHIEAAAMPHRLGDAQWNGNQIGEQKIPQAQRDGDRQPLFDQRPHRFVVVIAATEVEMRELPQHVEVALQRRLVETVELAQLGELLGRDALRTTVNALRRGGFTCRTAFLAAQLRHHLLHRPAGDELHHDEGEGEHAQQGGNHQQYALEDIGPEIHVGAPEADLALAHQHCTAQPSGW